MPQFAWAGFTQTRSERHLIVVDVPANVTDDPDALILLFIRILSPDSHFALSAEGIAEGTRMFCAFASINDADDVIKAVNAQESNKHPGWASEHYCRLDKCAAGAIRGPTG